MEMPEMPGLAEPVYEVKRTRLSPPSSGAYEAQAVTEVPPVTGTHWTNDGFERRVRARCEARQVLLTCHRCSSGLPVVDQNVQRQPEAETSCKGRNGWGS